MKRLDQLFTEVATAQEDLIETAQRRDTVRRRLELMGSRRVRQGVPPRVAVWAGIGAALTALFAVWLWREERPISVRAGASSDAVSVGTWVEAPEASSIPLQFSDGTKVEIAPRTKVRVLELGTRGAKLALESGRADVNVAKGEHRSWDLVVGPFTVHVTGTRFDVAWQPRDDRFELVLNEGQVEIAGCGFAEGRKLASGQSVRASCHDGSVDIAYNGGITNPGALAVPVETASIPTEIERPVPHASVKAQASALPTSTLGWRSLARDGRYVEALAAAERMGFEDQCARSDVGTLALLGEAALRARAPEKARQAWTTLRKRFAGTSQAAVAAFSLGVVEFDYWHARSKAADWFRLYLREDPRGPLSREARGRLLEALQSSGGNEVRSLARAYLKDYPSGPHAELAARLVESP